MVRKTFSTDFKSRVALETLKENKTMPEISSKFKVHSTQISKWKKQAISGLKETFSKNHGKNDSNHEQEINELYQQIGKLKVENDFLKKSVFQS